MTAVSNGGREDKAQAPVPSVCVAASWLFFNRNNVLPYRAKYGGSCMYEILCDSRLYYTTLVSQGSEDTAGTRVYQP